MNIDWSATAAWIVLGASIISPIVVAVINNLHQRKMYTLQKREDARADAINGYLSSLSAAIHLPTQDAINAYCTRYGMLTGYVPADALDAVDVMHRMVPDAGHAYPYSDVDADGLYSQYQVVRNIFYDVLMGKTKHTQQQG